MLYTYTVKMSNDYPIVNAAYHWCLVKYQGISDWDINGSPPHVFFSFENNSHCMEFMLVWI